MGKLVLRLKNWKKIREKEMQVFITQEIIAATTHLKFSTFYKFKRNYLRKYGIYFQQNCNPKMEFFFKKEMYEPLEVLEKRV